MISCSLRLSHNRKFVREAMCLCVLAGRWKTTTVFVFTKRNANYHGMVVWVGWGGGSKRDWEKFSSCYKRTISTYLALDFLGFRKRVSLAGMRRFVDSRWFATSLPLEQGTFSAVIYVWNLSWKVAWDITILTHYNNSNKDKLYICFTTIILVNDDTRMTPIETWHIMTKCNLRSRHQSYNVMIDEKNSFVHVRNI